MPKVTYKPRHPDDPEETTTLGHTFTKGKAVDVPDNVAAKLKANPWFMQSGVSDRAASEAAADAMAGDVGARLDSSVDVAYPPGGGMKYSPEVVKTEEGNVPAAEAPARTGAKPGK
jgi:hypothetical protein